MTRRNESETIQFTFPAHLSIEVTRDAGETVAEARDRAIAIAESLSGDNVYGDGGGGYVCRKRGSRGVITERRPD